jgi:hypothetical protein
VIGGQLQGVPVTDNWAYQAIYTLVFPITK